MRQADTQTRGDSKVMKLQKIGWSGLISILAALTIGEFRFIPNSQFKIINSQALAQTQAERKAEADRLSDQGHQQYQSRQFQAGLQSLQQALIIYREIKNRQAEGWALESLGRAYSHLGDYAKALDYAQQQLAIAREINDRRSEGRALGILKEAYYYLGNYAKALDYAQQQLAIAREINDSRSEVEADRNLRSAYDTIYNLDRYAEEIKSAQQQLAIAREIKDRQSEGKALGNLGIAYNDLGDYAKAIEYAQQQLAIAREIKDRQSEGTALGHLGNAYDSLGDYAKAIEYTQQLLAIAREIKDRKSEGAALGNLGSAYYSLGDYAKAIEYAQQKLAIAREIKDRQSEGKALGNMGIAYRKLGNYAQALAYAQQQLVIAREIKDRQSEGKALGNLGNAYLFLGDYAKAIEYAQQELAIAREIKDRQSEGEALGSLGLAYYSLGDYAKAIEYTQQWLAIAREIKDRPSEGTALNNLGVALANSGNLPAAEKTLLDSIKVSESLRAGLDDANKVSIFETQTNPYVILQKVFIAQKKTNDALEIAERGRARAFVELLASRQAPSASIATTIDPPNIQQIQQIAKEQNATLVEYSTIGNEALYIWVIKPTGEITFRSVNLKSLYINLPEATEETRVSAATGRRGLNEEDTALAEMIRGTRDALGVSGDTANRQAANPPASTPANSRIIYPKLQQIYQLLIQPIADLLPTDPNAPVIFIPHQSLFLVPFVALQDPTGQYLIEKHTILTAPAIQILQFTRQSRQKARQLSLQNNLVVGNPIMPKIGNPPRQLDPLPGSEREAITIAQLLKTQPITGAQATKSSIVQQMLKARIIHLATHGLLNEVKRRDLPGAIALAPSENDDGLLTSSEILDFKLNAELVVLSACNTGRGKLTGDGVVGLSRALISAGVPSIIVSLWLVPDAATAELMAEFYRQLQLNPNKAQALRQAMLITMKMHPTPQDWGAFTLIGEAE
ncbi:CHAT domain-containing tetratricopeptide repeat protein [Microcoleus sp. D2_18a_B4]|uniref:CHAT domain-containing tetratricopeptide repeat protein n=1 Tax=Microcoleus sp. D2_18a_B4 TaxID=3055329 RepID=UPI002FD4DF0E